MALIFANREVRLSWKQMSLRFRKMVNFCVSMTDHVCDDDMVLETLSDKEAQFEAFRKSQLNGMLDIARIMNQMYCLDTMHPELDVAIVEGNKFVLRISPTTTTMKVRPYDF